MSLVPLHVSRIALAERDHLVLALELRRRFAKCPAVPERASTLFAAQLQIPVLGKVLGTGQTVFLGADAAVTTAEIGRALPVSAVLAFVDMEFSSYELMLLGHSGFLSFEFV